MNCFGNIEEENSYDAWGNIRSASDWTSPLGDKLMFDRGFTGHEHLFFYEREFHFNPSTDLTLINMNGRVYDPVMSSFLSVDNYVQSPENSQNFNRYAYCLNNPLKYTDPSGEWFLTGGLGFGKKSNGEYGVTSASLGVNFGLIGFGFNLGFDGGLCSFGVYGELGPHIGSAGLNTSLGFDFNFKNSTITGSLSANFGISTGSACNLGIGASGFCNYSLTSGKFSPGFGMNLGASVHGDIWGAGIGVSYSRCDGQNSFGLGVSGFREMPKEVYNFGVKDNPQTKQSYCVPGTLEELCRSLGLTGTVGSAEWWAFVSLLYQQQSLECIRLIQNEAGYYQFAYPDSYNGTPQSLLCDMINSSNIATSEPINNANINSIIDAYKRGERVLVSATWNESGVNHGHAVAVSKVAVYSKAYRIYFADPSPVRQVPTQISTMKFQNGIHYKYYNFRLR